jgi:hypothetical protein
MKKIKMFCVIGVLMIATSGMLFAQAPDTVWMRKYNGPANNSDQGIGCAVYGSNLYISGYSHNGANYDALVIKYNALNGDTLWTRRYNGSANQDDGAFRCAVDGSGYFYITGQSKQTSSMSSSDYLAIKYNPAGDTIWTRIYNGPANNLDMGMGCAVDGSGNLYVTGESSNGTNNDYLTIKYNAATGDTLWTRRYNGPANGKDAASDCAVDGSGNLYVAGYSVNGAVSNILTVKYTANGDTLWTRRFSEAADSHFTHNIAGCAADGSGNVYVTGMCGFNAPSNRYCATTKYGPAGNTLWHKIYDSPSLMDTPSGCALDGAGNFLYITGSSYLGPHDHYFTIKYNAVTGDSIWVKSFLSSTAKTEYSIDCAVDGSGYLYLSGMSADTATFIGDYQTIKYNTGTGVDESKSGTRDRITLKVQPNPFISFTRIPSHEQEEFAVSDVSGRSVGMYKGEKIGENLTAGVYFIVPQNKELKPIRIVKIK